MLLTIIRKKKGKIVAVTCAIRVTKEEYIFMATGVRPITVIPTVLFLIILM